jgi:hypothetical protein
MSNDRISHTYLTGDLVRKEHEMPDHSGEANPQAMRSMAWIRCAGAGG